MAAAASRAPRPTPRRSSRTATGTGATACGGCHTLADAGTQGETGPDLDEVLTGKDEAFIEQSIVEPDAEIAQGFQDGHHAPELRRYAVPAGLDALVKYLSRGHEVS